MAHAEVISLNCPEDQIQEAMDSCPAVCIHWGESE
jgi:ferredoxin